MVSRITVIPNSLAAWVCSARLARPISLFPDNRTLQIPYIQNPSPSSSSSSSSSASLSLSK
ncbi:hypothetical protein TorRG33x02_306910, partial [Trema orientale]